MTFAPSPGVLGIAHFTGTQQRYEASIHGAGPPTASRARVPHAMCSCGPAALASCPICCACTLSPPSSYPNHVWAWRAHSWTAEALPPR